MKKTTKAEQFCRYILQSDIKRAKAFVNIIMALGSDTTAPNPTSLSESGFFQYHYCIINRVMEDFSISLKGEDSARFKSGLRQLFMDFLPQQRVYKFSSDFTPVRKPESRTLKDRGFIHVPNCRVFGNKPIDIGYTVSCVNLGLYDDEHPQAWSIPFDNVRIPNDADKIAVAVEQLTSLLEDENLPFGKCDKVLNAADSGYGIPEYICPLVAAFDNLLLLIRVRHGIKVWKPYEGDQKDGGRAKTYSDDPYYLHTFDRREVRHPRTAQTFMKEQPSIFNLPVDEDESYEIITQKGRLLIVQLYRWNDLLMRGKQGYKMDDKPFDLICVRFVDKETGECLHKRDMYLSLFGKQRRSHETAEAQGDYKHRYDIEGHNRFSKQQLLLDKYQTPEVENFEGWLWTVQMTYWLLYLASTDTEVCVKKWEQYLPRVKRAQESGERLSVAMTRKGAEILFSTFDLTPFAPQKSKNGTGRKKGTLMPKRNKCPPSKKKKNEQKIKQKVEQIE